MLNFERKPMKTILKLSFFYSFVFLFLIGCSKDDDDLDNSLNTFYKNAYKLLTINNLAGTWSIYSITYDGQIGEVPNNYQSCSRDFFTFSTENTFSEYIFQDSNCNFANNNYSVRISNGVIRLSNGVNYDEWVVTSISENQLVFKAKFDVDNDGTSEVIAFTAKKYQPLETDLYTSSFNYDHNFPNQMRLVWDAYKGFQTFEKYEIYRTITCNKSDAELIATITDAKTTFFIDEFPKPTKNSCYYLKLYTNKGLLGESYLVSISTNNIQLAEVTLAQPIANANSISLNWTKYTGFYFSHYEILMNNFEIGIIGYGDQTSVVAEIRDIEMTSFEQKDIPNFNNPTYYVIVHDIFGNKNYLNSTNGKQTNIKNKKIIDIKNVQLFTPDKTSSAVFLLGSTENYQETKLLKYNYSTKTIEAKSAKTGISNSRNIKLTTSATGEELFIGESFNTISIFKTGDLEYKYDLKFNEINLMYDFEELPNNIWVLIDREYLYTYKRNFTTVELISKERHFLTTQYNYSYHLIKGKNNSVFVGHYEEPTCFSFSIDANGTISNKTVINVPIKSKDDLKTVYNSTQNTLVNLLENKVYSVANQSLLYSYESPYYSSILNTQGTTIYGTNNDASWSINENSLHKKEVIKTKLSPLSTSKIATDGYSHFIFENYKGQIISISSGLKRTNLYYGAPNSTRDIFIEILE